MKRKLFGKHRLIAMALALLMTFGASPAAAASAFNNPVSSDRVLSSDVKAAVPVSRITLDKTSMSLGKGEEFRINASVYPANAANKAVTWSSGNNKVVTVVGGKLKGIGNGTATVTAKSGSGKTAKCVVTVKNAPSKITLTKGVLTLGVGESFTVGSGVNDGAASANRTYRTSNSSIVKMTNTKWTGSFTALKTGVAYVTVRTYNGKESTCKVTVKAAPSSVKLNRGLIHMTVGQSASLSAIVPDNSGCASRTFRTSNSSVVKMTRTNWTGGFRAVSEGTAYVTVRTYNGREASCKVIVHKTWREAYKEFLSENTQHSGFAFDLYDMDKDGIPELFYSGMDAHLYPCEMCYYSNYEMVKTKVEGSSWGTASINSNNQLVAGFQTGMGGKNVHLLLGIRVIKKVGSDFPVVCTFNEKVYSPDGNVDNEVTEYRINDKVVSEAEYNKTLAKYREGLRSIGRGHLLSQTNYEYLIDNY